MNRCFLFIPNNPKTLRNPIRQALANALMGVSPSCGISHDCMQKYHYDYYVSSPNTCWMFLQSIFVRSQINGHGVYNWKAHTIGTYLIVVILFSRIYQWNLSGFTINAMKNKNSVLSLKFFQFFYLFIDISSGKLNNLWNFFDWISFDL